MGSRSYRTAFSCVLPRYNDSYFDDDFGLEGKRAAKDKDGKPYYVPADMSYKEWKEKFVVKDLNRLFLRG